MNYFLKAYEFLVAGISLLTTRNIHEGEASALPLTLKDGPLSPAVGMAPVVPQALAQVVPTLQGETERALGCQASPGWPAPGSVEPRQAHSCWFCPHTAPPPSSAVKDVSSCPG